MALGVGIAAGGGGGYAVFASSNQAGTAILLILSAIFLLIGIQGTSLIRFSTGSNTVELERRKRTVERAVKEIAKEEPERAAGIIEGAELALPSFASIASTAEAALLAVQYGKRLSVAISAMGYTTRDIPRDYEPDLTVIDREGRVIHVAVTYSRNERPVTRRWVEIVALPHMGTIPLLLVANSPVAASAADWTAQMKREAPLRLISWRDDADNPVLRESLRELFSSIPPSENG